MKLIIITMFAFIIAFNTACSTNLEGPTHEETIDSNYGCFIGCLEAEQPKEKCKSFCYKDVVGKDS
jgi:hypothetical protein|tara:strand:+ start:613 stop:810 length:198 start_codon:yes stop_codon:yes gene_type:complete